MAPRADRLISRREQSPPLEAHCADSPRGVRRSGLARAPGHRLGAGAEPARRTQQPPGEPAPVPTAASTASTTTAAPTAPVAPSVAREATGPDASLEHDVAALKEEVRSLRAEVAAARAPPPPKSTNTNDDRSKAPEKVSVIRPLGYEPLWPWILPPEGISVGGYLQSQYEAHQDSQDQLLQGGAPMNKNRFSVRRARVGLTGEWEYVAIALQLDANTTNGPQVDLRKAEASLQYRPDRSKPPIVMATLGQFDTPFGYELVESPHTRWFMERSTASQAFWPGEPDLGVRFAGALGFFRWTIALVNGEPLGEKSPYVLQDPNSAKDAVYRFGFDAKPVENVQTAGGVSAYRGTGFHAGTDATKSTIQWTDLNGDGTIRADRAGRDPRPGRDTVAELRALGRWSRPSDQRAHSSGCDEGVRRVHARVEHGPRPLRRRSHADEDRPA